MESFQRRDRLDLTTQYNSCIFLVHQVEQAIKSCPHGDQLWQGCPNPVLEDHNPARFSVLPVRKPSEMGSQVKESPTGRLENWAGLWTEFGHPWKAYRHALNVSLKLQKELLCGLFLSRKISLKLCIKSQCNKLPWKHLTELNHF